MGKLIRLLFVCTAFLIAGLLAGAKVPEDNPGAEEVVQKMLNAIGNLKTLKFHLKNSERIKGKFFFTESQAKLQISPRKLYLYLRGPELLWKEGWNGGNALVNPGGFPYVNLNLDPMCSILRENQHHTIHEMGFEYYGDVLKYALQKLSEEEISRNFKLVGETKWNQRDCYLISVEYPEFKFIEYKVKKGENLITIARSRRIAEYMILEQNTPKLKDYHDVKEGQTILIPNAYARKTLMFIDREYFLPINTKIYDDKGLFESYEYHSLEVNPKISDEEFTKSYKGYKF